MPREQEHPLKAWIENGICVVEISNLKRGWKNVKLESLKSESFCLSWKEHSEVGTNRAKLERFERSWKEPSEVGKFLLKFESIIYNSMNHTL